MVIYIHEQRDKARREKTQFVKPAASVNAKSQLHNFLLETWVDNLTEPYSMTFLTPTRALMTEKRGNVYLIENGKIAETPLTGVPEVDKGGQAGLFDVVLHPKYAENGWIYFAYSDPQKNVKGEPVSLTRIIRGKVRDGALVDQETVFQAKPEHYVKAGGVHFGGRIAFDKQGFLYFSIGERGGPADRGGKMVAQDLGQPLGKIHRIHDDGRIPADNPFVKDPNALPSIWSYGHRNPQGLAVHPVTNEVFNSEHGPRGGDEINLVGKGKNYGWPVITYGMEYNGTAMTDLTHKEGMEQPLTYWTPSIAVCGMNFYTGDKFPKWKNQLFLSSLAGMELRRIELKDGKVAAQEVLFKGAGDTDRMRDVIQGPDGSLYVMFKNRISRITPAP
jgi:glucose/arabinose dehydrogenase